MARSAEAKRKRERREGDAAAAGDPAAVKARYGGALSRWGTWQTRMLMYRVARRGAIFMAGNTPQARRRFTRLRRKLRL